MRAYMREVAERRRLRRRVNASGEQSATFYGILLRPLRMVVTLAKGVVSEPQVRYSVYTSVGSISQNEQNLNFSLSDSDQVIIIIYGDYIKLFLRHIIFLFSLLLHLKLYY